MQMYKVFFKDRLFHIKSHKGYETEQLEDQFDNLIAKFLSDYGSDVDFYCSQPVFFLKRLKKRLKYIEASGGLVFNNYNEFLCLERFGVPDLPKGKIERGEDTQTAALRETTEETGLRELIIVKELDPTFHIYFEKEFVLKKTFWFQMLYTGTRLPVPQVEEGISLALFYPTEKAGELGRKSYRNLRELYDFAASKYNFP